MAVYYGGRGLYVLYKKMFKDVTVGKHTQNFLDLLTSSSSAGQFKLDSSLWQAMLPYYQGNNNKDFQNFPRDWGAGTTEVIKVI